MRSRELRCLVQQTRLGRRMSRYPPYIPTSLHTPNAMHQSSRVTPISVLVHFHSLRIFRDLNFLKLHLKSQKWWIPRQMTSEGMHGMMQTEVMVIRTERVFRRSSFLMSEFKRSKFIYTHPQPRTPLFSSASAGLGCRMSRCPPEDHTFSLGLRP